MISCIARACLLLAWSRYCTSHTTHYDVIVYRATPGGIAAALSAHHLQAKVLLVEPTAHIGGMATEGGIGLRDAKNERLRSDPDNTQYRWGRLNAAHYGVDDVVWQPDGWVGEHSFWQMLDGVEVLLKSDIIEGRDGIEMDICSPSRVRALVLENGTRLTADYFIDGGYEADLMRATGVDATYGRESNSQYGETGAGITNHSAAQFEPGVDPLDDEGNLLPFIEPGDDPTEHLGEADSNVMAYSYRVCLTNDKERRVAIQPPANYNPNDFELARRVIEDELARNESLSAPWLNLAYIGYDKLATTQKFDACCGASPIGIDAVGLNVGYPGASRAVRQQMADEHRYYVESLLWFWQTDKSIPKSIRKGFKHFGLCGDEWLDNGHFPRQLYIREAWRVVGDDVFTELDRQRICRDDSIAVAEWGLDVHDVRRVGFQLHGQWVVRNEGLRGDAEDQGGVFPFELPYWILLPKRNQLANLAVVGGPSVSHVAFAAIRTEPTLWTLGQAAGTAAALAVLNGADSFHDVDVPAVQRALLEQGVVIHWPPKPYCRTARTIT